MEKVHAIHEYLIDLFCLDIADIINNYIVYKIYKTNFVIKYDQSDYEIIDGVIYENNLYTISRHNKDFTCYQYSITRNYLNRECDNLTFLRYLYYPNGIYGISIVQNKLLLLLGDRIRSYNVTQNLESVFDHKYDEFKITQKPDLGLNSYGYYSSMGKFYDGDNKISEYPPDMLYLKNGVIFKQNYVVDGTFEKKINSCLSFDDLIVAFYFNKIVFYKKHISQLKIHKHYKYNEIHTIPLSIKCGYIKEDYLYYINQIDEYITFNSCHILTGLIEIIWSGKIDIGEIQGIIYNQNLIIQTTNHIYYAYSLDHIFKDYYLPRKMDKGLYIDNNKIYLTQNGEFNSFLTEIQLDEPQGAVLHCDNGVIKLSGKPHKYLNKYKPQSIAASDKYLALFTSEVTILLKKL